jgi:hypothetical protein
MKEIIDKIIPIIKIIDPTLNLLLYFINIIWNINV